MPEVKYKELTCTLVPGDTVFHMPSGLKVIVVEVKYDPPGYYLVQFPKGAQITVVDNVLGALAE